MNKGCCTNCQGKSKKMKKQSKKLKEEFHEEEDVKQKHKVSEKDSDSDNEASSDEDDKKKKILTWQKTSTKKEKHQGDNKNKLTAVNQPPSYSARPMMYHRGGGGPDTSNWWPVTPYPRGGEGRYPPFSMPPPPIYGGGPYGGYGGPFQPYHSMPPRGPMYNGAHISPYQPMPGAYWQTRPFSDTNPMTRYTSYKDNYSYFFI